MNHARWRQTWGSLLLFAAVALLMGCSHRRATPPATPVVGVLLDAIDHSAQPCDDFFQYACGRWIADNPIPADQSSWGLDAVVNERNRAELRSLLDTAAAGRHAAGATPVIAKVGTYYAACMDEAQIDAAGAAPLRDELARIDALAATRDLAAEVAALQSSGADVLFDFGSDQDFKDANREIEEADQGGLGLPDRDYYTRTDADARRLVAAYRDHVRAMFVLAGDTPAAAAGETAAVLRLETALARASMTEVARRDPAADYHKMDWTRFRALAPTFDWDAYRAAAQAPALKSLNVVAPDFFRGLDRELRAAPLADWKSYLRWHLIHAAAPALSQPFVDANFAFYQKTLRGTPQLPPRWKRCVSSTDANLGEALGQLYVKAAFGPEQKRQVQAMAVGVEQALARDIAQLPWMDAATKRQALIKLRAVTLKIGYPDRWRDYSALTVADHDYYGNWVRAQRFEWHRQLNKAGRAVDRSEWDMTPPTVNAYYNDTLNEFVLPAGILQPPFFSLRQDAAMNYGQTAGSTIGHELTHGFDDEGRQFDAQGNLRDWWTPADARAFQRRADCLVHEYARATPVPGVHLNGQLTLGENTADNGGVRLGLMAMEAALGGQPDDHLDGFTREQRYFLGYAQSWCEAERPELLRMAAVTDPHAPARYRVNDVVVNMPEFAQAFHCGPQAPMNAGPRACRVW